MVSLPDESKLKFQFPKKLRTICLALIGGGVLLMAVHLGVAGLTGGHDAGHAPEATTHAPAGEGHDGMATEGASESEEHAAARSARRDSTSEPRHDLHRRQQPRDL